MGKFLHQRGLGRDTYRWYSLGRSPYNHWDYRLLPLGLLGVRSASRENSSFALVVGHYLLNGEIASGKGRGQGRGLGV